MSTNRGQRATRTFAASLAGTAVGVLVGLVTTPLLLRFLGDERVGVYRVALEWIGYAVLVDFGLTGTLRVLLGRAVGTGDRPGVAAAVRAGARGALVVAVLGAVYVGVLAAAAPLLLAGMTPELAYELRVGLLCGLVGFVWSPLVGFRSLVEAEQRGHLVHAALTAQAVLTGAMSVGFAAAGFGLPGQFLAAALGAGVAAVWLAVDGVRRNPEVLSAPTGPPVPLRAAFNLPMFLFQLFGRLGQFSDCIVIGYVLGPAAVVVFSLTQRLLMLADGQVLALGGSVWAALSELHHAGRAEAFHDRLTQLTRLTAVLAFALAVPIAAFTPSFVHLWVGPTRYGGPALAWWTAVYIWTHGVVALWAWPLVSTGRVRAVLPAMLAATVVNVVASVGLTHAMGVAGPAIGSAVGLGVVLAYPIARLLRREFGTPVGPLLRAAVGPAAVAVPYAAGLGLLAAAIAPEALPVAVWVKWAVVLGGIGLGAVGYFALAWVLVLTATDRGEMRARVRGR